MVLFVYAEIRINKFVGDVVSLELVIQMYLFGLNWPVLQRPVTGSKQFMSIKDGMVIIRMHLSISGRHYVLVRPALTEPRRAWSEVYRPRKRTGYILYHISIGAIILFVQTIDRKFRRKEG